MIIYPAYYLKASPYVKTRAKNILISFYYSKTQLKILEYIIKEIEKIEKEEEEKTKQNKDK